jgi:hypothetical protein
MQSLLLWFECVTQISCIEKTLLTGGTIRRQLGHKGSALTNGLIHSLTNSVGDNGLSREWVCYKIDLSLASLLCFTMYALDDVIHHAWKKPLLGASTTLLGSQALNCELEVSWSYLLIV